MLEQWDCGAVVALRMFRRGKVFLVRPMRVVEDSNELIALFLAGNTATRTAMLPGLGRAYDRSLPYEVRHSGEWELHDDTWRNTSVLMLTRPGVAHSYWAFWDAATWDFVAWYVNCQAPLARSPVGFDSEDHDLDIVIEPDLSTWRWKDEADLADGVRVGRFTTDEAERIRYEGMQAISALESRAWPFDCGWEDFRPPDWENPGPELEWEELPRASG